MHLNMLNADFYYLGVELMGVEEKLPDCLVALHIMQEHHSISYKDSKPYKITFSQYQ